MWKEMIVMQFKMLHRHLGYAVAQLFEALHYKP